MNIFFVRLGDHYLSSTMEWRLIGEAKVFTHKPVAAIVARDMGGEVVEFRLVESSGGASVTIRVGPPGVKIEQWEQRARTAEALLRRVAAGEPGLPTLADEHLKQNDPDYVGWP